MGIEVDRNQADEFKEIISIIEKARTNAFKSVNRDLLRCTGKSANISVARCGQEIG